MMKQRITIDIAPDGTVRIEAEGFAGASCAEATAALERALGTVAQRERKPEYYRPQRAANANRLRTGRE